MHSSKIMAEGRGHDIFYKSTRATILYVPSIRCALCPNVQFLITFLPFAVFRWEIGSRVQGKHLTNQVEWPSVWSMRILVEGGKRTFGFKKG